MRQPIPNRRERPEDLRGRLFSFARRTQSARDRRAAGEWRIQPAPGGAPGSAGSGVHPLAEDLLNGPGQGEGYVGWQAAVLLPQRQEEPAVLEYVEGGRDVPERRQDDGDVAADPLQLGDEPVRVFHVLDGVGAEDVLELIVSKRRLVDIEQHESGQLGVLYDICVHAAAVGSPAAEVQIPFPPSQDTVLHQTITEIIGSEEDADHCNDPDEDGHSITSCE